MAPCPLIRRCSCTDICRVSLYTASAAALTQGATGALGPAQLWMEMQAAATPLTASQPRPPGAALHQLAATRIHPARLSVSAAGGVLPTRRALPGPSQNVPHCNPGAHHSMQPRHHTMWNRHKCKPNALCGCTSAVLLYEVTHDFLLDQSNWSCLMSRLHMCQVYINLDLEANQPAQGSLLSSLHPFFPRSLPLVCIG